MTVRRLATYLGIGAVSCSTLMVEILLTRITSVTAWYHLAFFVISLAMLGMTAGAVAVFLRPDRFGFEHAGSRLYEGSLGLALSLPPAICVALAVPVQHIETLVDFVALLLVGSALALPFWFAGVVLAVALTRAGLPPGRAYAVDLVAGAGGCLLLIPLLNLVDAVSAIFASAAVAAAGAVAFGVSTGRARRAPLIVAASLAAVAVGNAVAAVPPLRPAWIKGEHEDYGRFDYVGWNTYSRVTVTRSEERAPDLWGRGQRAGTAVEGAVAQRLIQIDGDAGTAMAAFDGDLSQHAYLDWDVSSIAHVIRPDGPVAVIGVGGGRDVLEALRSGHSRVTGIELNDLIVDLHRRRLRTYSGLAQTPGVELVSDEARSYLSRDPRRYAMIVMSLIDTWAATGAGAYALSENGLYTVEAWRLFLSRLQPGGVFSVSRWYIEELPGETARMLCLAFEALAREGAVDPRRHLALVVAERVATLVVARDPLSAEDVTRLLAESRHRGFRLAAAPDRVPQHPLLAAIWRAASSRERARVASTQQLNLTAATDDRPFFFNTLKLATWLGRGNVDKLDPATGNLHATATLVCGIAVALLLTLLTVAVPLWKRRQEIRSLPRRPVLSAAVYFALIGVGFMYVEMGLLSRLNVFLGHPILGLAVLLGGLIAFTGLGSFLSSYVPVERRAVAIAYPLLPAMAILMTVALLPRVVAGAASAATPARAAIALLALLPVGAAMGLGFPLGLRLCRAAVVRSEAPEADALGPWLWGINGACGVCGSGLALGTSMAFGISTTLTVGAVAYGVLPLCTAILAGAGRARETGRVLPGAAAVPGPAAVN